MPKTEVIYRSDLVDHMGSDMAIVRAARVSTVGKNEPEEDAS